MSKWEKRHSLSVQLFCGVLLSFLMATAVFIVFFILGDKVLDQTVYGQPFMKQMSDKQFQELQRYVKEENVTAANLYPLDIWCSRGDKVYLTVYISNQILYASPVSAETDIEPEAYDPFFENPEQEYALTLSDGIAARAFLYYYAGEAYYYWTVVISGIVAFIVFSVCFITFIHRKLQYIKKLKSELDILAGGDLNYTITIKGSDELSELAQGIDKMRESILIHQKSEEEIRVANTELVTAMSHDLRTPLTSLLAYLELMDREKYEDVKQLRHFISRSLDKTFQIKSMADKLFEYFLVYSTSLEAPPMEDMPADELLQQLWGEYAFALEKSGFTVICNFNEVKGGLQVNADLLKRAFDNIYSNILKYADNNLPVTVSYKKIGSHVHIIVSNSIAPQREKRESTNIGLNTCERIIQQHNGSFSVQEDGNLFRISILLPLVK